MIKDTTNREINILVIDDDVDVCHFLKNLLTKHGFAVQFVTDPTEALTTLSEKVFQIVLLDMVMPKIDGLALLQDIRRTDDDICVIVVSGYPTFDRAVESFKHAAFDFVSKPFETSVLLDSIDRAIKRYGLISDLNQKATAQIARKVRTARNDQKLSMRQLASRTGLSPSLIYQIEHSQTAPSLATLCRIATALKVPLEQFFAGL